ncbi:hypothetical protein EDD86DRAFT_249238 [Gorgonomyces haynaldii]|nr:hypothetical protein EDD86DRAFT_249238 [Gorgonomyces haynaldii]
MYDITDMSSFVKLHKWIKRLDLLHERQVSPDLHKQLFQEHKFRLDCLLSCQDHSKALELLKSIGNVLMPLHKEHY